jgi:hypothetical protein
MAVRSGRPPGSVRYQHWLSESGHLLLLIVETKISSVVRQVFHLPPQLLSLWADYGQIGD